MCKCHAFCREGAQLLLLCGCLILVLEGDLCSGPHATLIMQTCNISCAGKSKGCPCWAYREWLLWRPKQCCPDLAGACLWDKSGVWFWVAFLQKSLYWLSKCRESFTALGERTLAPLVRDGPASSAPAHPTAQGYGGKWHWLLAGSCASRESLSPWVLYHLHSLWSMEWFQFVLFCFCQG